MNQQTPLPRFSPPRWIPNRHLMTITASLVRVPPRLPLQRERWELPDGDFLTWIGWRGPGRSRRWS